MKTLLRRRCAAALAVAMLVAAGCGSGGTDNLRTEARELRTRAESLSAQLEDLRTQLEGMESSSNLAWRELDFCRAVVEMQTALAQTVLTAPGVNDFERSGLELWLSSLEDELQRLGADADAVDRAFVSRAKRVVARLREAGSWAESDPKFRMAETGIRDLASPHDQKYLCGRVPV